MVDAELRNVQLVDLLERNLPPTRRQGLRQLLGAGRVRVNGETVLTNRRLRAGDVVQVGCAELPPPGRPRADLPEVKFESASALVIDKPAGVPVVPDRSGHQRGIHGLLGQLRPGADLRIVHRLDRDTSGCLLLGVGHAASRHFDVQFREGKVQKRYFALVHGVPASPAFAVDAWLGPDPARPGKVVAADQERPGFRRAHTDVELVRAFSRHALLALRPTTGRGHQLRVHLRSVGHPIVGDLDYGGSQPLLSEFKRGYKLRAGVVERPLLERMFLHAASLAFTDLDGSPVAVDAPLPGDLATVLQKLERFDEGRR